MSPLLPIGVFFPPSFLHESPIVFHYIVLALFRMKRTFEIPLRILFCLVGGASHQKRSATIVTKHLEMSFPFDSIKHLKKE